MTFFEILDNECIVTVSFQGDDVINFEFIFSFLIKLFFCMTRTIKTQF